MNTFLQFFESELNALRSVFNITKPGEKCPVKFFIKITQL